MRVGDIIVLHRQIGAAEKILADSIAALRDNGVWEGELHQLFIDADTAVCTARMELETLKVEMPTGKEVD
jgi:hypothetical protein